ncbi:MAG: Cd2+/Zn2+-exporting ATPase [Rhodothermales bacterium]|jgi:Cd2+/Zn2+-exporting ATPase
MTETAPDRKLLWATGGFIFMLNAFVLARVVPDGGFVSSVSGLIAVILLLIPMIGTIIEDLKAGQLRMHELAVVAVFASCMQGDFKTSAAVALFMLISIIIEQRTASGARTSLEALAKLTPGKARRLDADGNETECDGFELHEGDRIRVLPGENILADGIILKGRSSVNEANITGESLPVDKQEEAQVYAGTTNLSGVIELNVTRAGEDTTLGKVRELILKAEQSKLPFVRIIDQYFRYYTPFVLVIAATVLFFTRHLPDGTSRVVALLVATCPIAIILATPAAIVAALSAAARVGVLFKDVNDIEALTRMNAFVFDKTGTLTSGLLEVSRMAPCSGIESSALLAAAAIAESASNHPIALAVQRLAKKVNLDVPRADEVHEEPGRGVRISHEGSTICAGNLAWMEENNVTRAEFAKIDEAEALGASLLFIIRDGKALGWLAVSDSPRPDSKAALVELEALGVRHTAIVSGDRERVVEEVAANLGVKDTRAGCTPAEKVEYIDAIKEQGYRVVFVGDGVNDAPALTASHIGIAMGAAGSDVALESATVALMNNDMNRLPFLVRLARRMKATVAQNFIVGTTIILGGVALSAAGALSPMLAGALQVAGALIVAMNSARLIRQGEDLDDHKAK